MWQRAREQSRADCPKSTSEQKGVCSPRTDLGVWHLRSISICCSTSGWKQEHRKYLESFSSQRKTRSPRQWESCCQDKQGPSISPAKLCLGGLCCCGGSQLGGTLRFLLPRLRAPRSASSGGNHSQACRAPPEGLVCWGEDEVCLCGSHPALGSSGTPEHCPSHSSETCLVLPNS